MKYTHRINTKSTCRHAFSHKRNIQKLTTQKETMFNVQFIHSIYIHCVGYSVHCTYIHLLASIRARARALRTRSRWWYLLFRIQWWACSIPDPSKHFGCHAMPKAKCNRNKNQNQIRAKKKKKNDEENDEVAYQSLPQHRTKLTTSIQHYKRQWRQQTFALRGMW